MSGLFRRVSWLSFGWCAAWLSFHPCGRHLALVVALGVLVVVSEVAVRQLVRAG